MIEFDDVSIRYTYHASPIIAGLTLTITEGEFVLVLGPTGSGKSTLLGAINGLVPHFTGGVVNGDIRVDGRSTSNNRPRDLADVVGVVPQDPLASFVTDTVEEELAYTMECLGIAPTVMRRRVEETLDLLGLEELRHRPLRSLSGGQRQRVAIGAVLTAHPRVLVLDEPTSALDPGAAEEVLAALHRLVHDLGVTVVLAEHRLERVIQYADRVIALGAPGTPTTIGDPATIMTTAAIAPPVVHLGRVAGWDPTPVTVRDARRQASTLRHLLLGHVPPVRPVPDSDEVAHLRDVSVRYGSTTALRSVSLSLRAGDVVALMGRNGAGKSTLLHSLVGRSPVSGGTIDVSGTDPATLDGPALVHRVGLVPQEPGDLLETSTVAEECAASDRDAGCDAGTTRALLALLAPEITDSTHPRDLSEGQRLLLALCIVLASRPTVICLDEPTRGLDYATKDRLAGIVTDLADAGHAIVLATHDVELAAVLSSRVVIVADGEVVADGPTSEVITSSPMFAPQVAKVLAPQTWLSVEQVRRALDTQPPHKDSA
jgi:energy-coupling factor transporter ATP-binding protein EcfA2